ncbi:MAG: uroporphyrinogen decarboxylase [Actinomycetota bacterium]|nr:uroporphyrinogen decarboxylase [Actinomycetota bacterium]
MDQPKDDAHGDGSRVGAAFLDALAGNPVQRVPVWFMRQAGRSLPEYRALRGVGSILDALRQPDLAAEITMQPVRRYGVDAAILYSDIIVPVHAAGFGMDIVPGRGPVAEHPFRESADLARLSRFSADEDCDYVASTVKLVAAESPVPLIGLAGAPFTVASYLIEGEPSRSFVRTKQLMHQEPGLFHALCARLVDMTVDFLSMQAGAGAQALQIFDSWVGALSEREYRRFVLPHMKEIFSRTTELDLPVILFGTNTNHLLEALRETGSRAIGLDHRTEIPEAVDRLGVGTAVQGNLDPTICLCSYDVVEEEARAVLEESRAASAYVFNLGHGVFPETDPGKLAGLVEFVHEQGLAIRQAEGR